MVNGEFSLLVDFFNNDLLEAVKGFIAVFELGKLHAGDLEVELRDHLLHGGLFEELFGLELGLQLFEHV